MQFLTLVSHEKYETENNSVSTSLMTKVSILKSRGGGSHILRHTGMCGSNGSLFHKKSLNTGPIFNKNILKHESVFSKFPKFLVVHHVNTRKL